MHVCGGTRHTRPSMLQKVAKMHGATRALKCYERQHWCRMP
ncbi:LOW QUALITY PROTEIN: hypothetical protein PanWU01x14_115560 [Parasponia andersonii]|uniref:Uncharacterized protein n=1 Tax=Parasponia andersonii TaxID=3476 RepID=A0A2P5CWX6_PARAD|nr:LOW QUALITY PROTEIN: hypothetical protein PanWU01x14_115560 [Parasponia andersonii]